MVNYYVLLSREDKSKPWMIEFGDYERSTVKDELRDYRDHDIRASNLKIITTGDTKEEIEAAVAKLNT